MKAVINEEVNPQGELAFKTGQMACVAVIGYGDIVDGFHVLVKTR